MARTRLIQAIHDGVVEEMTRDPKVIVYGEDVELSIVGDLRGVHEEFGHDRIRNTPICETSLTGMAVGLAAAGYRPVVQMMFANFMYTGMDAIGNQMSKLRLMTGGQMELPITIIATVGGGSANAAQHSDTPYGMLMNLGGIKVAVPATAADAKGLVKTAIRDPNPCFILEPNGRGGGYWPPACRACWATPTSRRRTSGGTASRCGRCTTGTAWRGSRRRRWRARRVGRSPVPDRPGWRRSKAPRRSWRRIRTFGGACSRPWSRRSRGRPACGWRRTTPES